MKRMSKIAGMLAAVALAGGLTIGGTGTARADVVPPAGTWAEVFDPYTSAPACLDDPGGSRSGNTPIELWHCHGYDSQGTPQRWYFGLVQATRPGVALYQIGTPTGLCLGVTSHNYGQRLSLQDCNLAQTWYLISRNAYSGDPVFQLAISGGSYCMSLPDLSGGNAEPVTLGLCGPGQLNSYWMLG
jgi:hypothetical protein